MVLLKISESQFLWEKFRGREGIGNRSPVGGKNGACGLFPANTTHGFADGVIGPAAVQRIMPFHVMELVHLRQYCNLRRIFWNKMILSLFEGGSSATFLHH